jgi:hypothetical protein
MLSELTPVQLGFAAAAVGLLLVLLLVVWVRRRRHALMRRMRKAGFDMLSDILVPNGEGGEIHVEHVLLSPRGLVLVDIKIVDGNVFGSDSMPDWTVISAKRRFTFNNPQQPLYDRLAAVRRIVPGVPVEGYVAFTSGAEFTKGQPSNVTVLDALLDELAAEMRADPLPEDYRAGWDKLREEAIATQVGHLLKDS